MNEGMNEMSMRKEESEEQNRREEKRRKNSERQREKMKGIRQKRIKMGQDKNINRKREHRFEVEEEEGDILRQ